MRGRYHKEVHPDDWPCNFLGGAGVSNGENAVKGEPALDPAKLTFSQAYGYEELPRPLKLGEIDRESRVNLWNQFYNHLVLIIDDIDFHYEEAIAAREIIRFLHTDFFVLPVNAFVLNSERIVYEYESMFMNDPFNEVFDLLLAVMRHPDCPQTFPESVSRVFKECRLAYVLDVGSPPTIYPSATPQEGENILRANAELIGEGLVGAVSHLRQAADCVNRGDHSGAMRESIHAVESTARHFDPNAKTLNPALKALEDGGNLHPALKGAFSKLYGYTSDEQGIRHALIDNPQANVDQDEAVFMLGACASFSSYLARKHQRRAS